MKKIDLLSIILLIIGGLNWGLVGLFNLNVIDMIFVQAYAVARIIYVLVGLSALWRIFEWKAICKRWR